MPATVASSQKLASAAGVEILRRGGNAADAAIAMAAALSVTEPCSTGLGGDCFALYSSGGKITALNGSGRSAAALAPGCEWSAFHANTVTVPGACAGWFDLLERHGTKPMAEVLAPAIRLAEEGFEVGPVTAHFWSLGSPRLTSGELRLTGPRFRNPGLARAFRAMAGGRDAFYRGPVAESIVRAVRERGGCLSLDDLASHESAWVEPIFADYRDLRVWECPPNGQGVVALLALKILERFDVEGADRWHVMVEALRLAFEVAREDLVPDLPDRAPELARRIRLDRAGPGRPSASSDTVFLCVVDARGDACSFINSNYMGFGTGIVPEGWGFSLQNRGFNFSLEPGHSNRIGPRKRPYHTIMPGMLTRRDGSLYGPFGVMGGFMQPQGHVQVVDALVHGLDPQAALDRPRFCIEEGRLFLEEGFPYAGDLAARGHDVVRGVTGFERVLFGRGQIIRLDPPAAGSDSRADGCWISDPGS